jgi:type III pantothenate kinase
LVNLVLDIGNTRTKLGIFSAGHLLYKDQVEDLKNGLLEQLVLEFWVEQVFVSSVTRPSSELLPDLTSMVRVNELSHLTPLPFVNAYQTPETLGKDRLAAVAGAQALFPATDCVVVDAGTCIKYEVLLAEGRYLGGNIAPGLHMRSEAMHVFTAKLPEVPLKLPNQSVGFSTETALQNGAYLGAILESEGVVRRFEQEIGREFKVLFTGGDGWFLKEHFRDANANYQPNLVLIGLDYIGSYQGMP